MHTCSLLPYFSQPTVQIHVKWTRAVVCMEKEKSDERKEEKNARGRSTSPWICSSQFENLSTLKIKQWAHNNNRRDRLKRKITWKNKWSCPHNPGGWIKNATQTKKKNKKHNSNGYLFFFSISLTLSIVDVVMSFVSLSELSGRVMWSPSTILPLSFDPLKSPFVEPSTYLATISRSNIHPQANIIHRPPQQQRGNSIFAFPSINSVRSCHIHAL